MHANRVATLIGFLIFSFLTGTNATTTTTPTPTTYTYTLVSTAIDCPSPYVDGTLVPVVSPVRNGTDLVSYADPEQGNVQSLIEASFGPYENYRAGVANSSQLVFFLLYGQSIVIDNHGARLYTTKCDQTLLLSIPNLLDVLQGNSSDSTPSRIKRSPAPLDEPTPALSTAYTHDITVTIDFLNQCGSPINGENASIYCNFIYSNYHFANPGAPNMPMKFSGNGTYLGRCTVPDFPQIYKTCEASIKSHLAWITTDDGTINTLPGTLAAAPEQVKQLQQIIHNGVRTGIPSNVATQFKVPQLAKSVQFLPSYLNWVLNGGPGGPETIASTWCTVLTGKASSFETGARIGLEPYFSTIAQESNDNFTDVSATQTVSFSTVTCSPTPSPH